MKTKIKKLLSVILTVMILFTVIPFSVSAADKYSDIKGHWAENAINTWSEYGILLGYPEGTFGPGGDITRAEMAAIINRVMDYTQKSYNGTFSDVSATDWFSDDLLKLHAAGIVSGTNGQVKPNEKITREEAVTMIAKAFEIYDENARTNFTDEGSIAGSALPYVRGMKANRYINGYPDGSFGPKSVLTRAEVVTVLDNVIKGFYNTYATYGTSSRNTPIDGNVVISSPDVSLINYDVRGNVYITPGVDIGQVDLTGTTISGTLYVWGGLIRLENSNITNMVLKSNGTRVSAKSSTLRNVSVLSGTFDADASTKITSIDMTDSTINLLYRTEVDRITAAGGAINVGDYSTVSSITATGTKIDVKVNSVVDKITIGRGTGVSLRVDGKVGELMSDENIQVSGSGIVDKSNLVNENAITLKSIVPDGSTAALTSKLTLTFDKDIPNFSINDIAISMVNNINTGAVKGTLTKTANTTGVYELTLSNIGQSGSINVAVTKSGYEITDSRTQKEVYIYYVQTTNAVVSNPIADGNQSYRTSKITVTLDQDILNLGTTDFTLSDPNNTGAAIGGVTKTGTGIYELTIINIAQSGNITLSLTKAGYTFSTSASTTATKTSTYVSGNIYIWYNVNALTQISFTGLTQIGGSTTTTTTKLQLSFNVDNIQPANIVISGGTASGSVGTATANVTSVITRTGYGVYEVDITPNITTAGYTAGNINVTVTPPTGYTYTPSSRSVTIYKPVTSTISFSNLTQNGSNSSTTTRLTLTFSPDFTNMSTTTIYNAISFSSNSTGITKQSISSLGNGQYELYVTGITASGNVTVNIGTISGYTISGASRTVQVYYYGNNDVSLLSVVPNSAAGATTTMLTLTFDKPITNFTASDITLSGGATINGSVSGSNGVYTIPITVTATTASTTISVRVSKTGYTILGSPYNVTVYHVDPTTNVRVTGISSNGEVNSTTTNAVFIQLDKEVDLTGNISISGGSTGARLSGIGINGITYTIDITGITQSGNITVTISKPGYTFNNLSTYTATLPVYYVAP